MNPLNTNVILNPQAPVPHPLAIQEVAQPLPVPPPVVIVQPQQVEHEVGPYHIQQIVEPNVCGKVLLYVLVIASIVSNLTFGLAYQKPGLIFAGAGLGGAALLAKCVGSVYARLNRPRPQAQDVAEPENVTRNSTYVSRTSNPRPSVSVHAEQVV